VVTKPYIVTNASSTQASPECYYIEWITKTCRIGYTLQDCVDQLSVNKDVRSQNHLNVWEVSEKYGNRLPCSCLLVPFWSFFQSATVHLELVVAWQKHPSTPVFNGIISFHPHSQLQVYKGLLDCCNILYDPNVTTVAPQGICAVPQGQWSCFVADSSERYLLLSFLRSWYKTSTPYSYTSLYPSAQDYTPYSYTSLYPSAQDLLSTSDWSSHGTRMCREKLAGLPWLLVLCEFPTFTLHDITHLCLSASAWKKRIANVETRSNHLVSQPCWSLFSATHVICVRMSSFSVTGPPGSPVFYAQCESLVLSGAIVPDDAKAGAGVCSRAGLDTTFNQVTYISAALRAFMQTFFHPRVSLQILGIQDMIRHHVCLPYGTFMPCLMYKNAAWRCCHAVLGPQCKLGYMLEDEWYWLQLLWSGDLLWHLPCLL
jgi:hypothetical protein